MKNTRPRKPAKSKKKTSRTSGAIRKSSRRRSPSKKKATSQNRRSSRVASKKTRKKLTQSKRPSSRRVAPRKKAAKRTHPVRRKGKRPSKKNTLSLILKKAAERLLRKAKRATPVNTGALKRVIATASKKEERKKKKLSKLFQGIARIEAVMAGRVSEKPRKRKEQPVPEPPVPASSVLAESRAEVEADKAKRLNHNPAAFNSLVDMFNKDCVDMVYKDKNGQYRPEDKKHKATHKLVPTEWTSEDDVKEMEAAIRPKFIGRIFEVEALAVCAVPIKRALRRSKIVTIKSPLPKSTTKWPAYRTNMSINGKRMILKEYAALTGCWRIMRPKINEMGHAECDQLVREFAMESRWLRHKIKNDPKNIAYWAERKAKQEAEKTSKPVVKEKKKDNILDYFTRDERKVIGFSLAEAIKHNQIK